MKKQVTVTKENREFLEKAFKVSSVMIWKALTFESDTDLARRIRKLAVERGGIEMCFCPVLETMQGDGSLSTRDLSLSGVKAIDQIADAVKQPSLKDMKVKDMTLDFTIKDGRVETKPFDIKMGDYTLNLSGSTGLDQTIDYSGKVKLPASVGNISKLMTLDLKIGGSFTSPKVSVDTKSMANQAVEAVADEAISKLGQKLGLDSAATANKDSIKQKVTEKAAEKALDFLKKKLK